MLEKHYRTLKHIDSRFPEDMTVIIELPITDQYQVVNFLIDLMDASNYDNIFLSRYLFSKIPEIWLVNNLPTLMSDIESSQCFDWNDEWLVRRMAEAMSFSGLLLDWTLKKASSSQDANVLEVVEEFQIYLPHGTDRYEVVIDLTVR